MKVFIKFVSLDDEMRYGTISVHVHRQCAGTLTMPRTMILDFVAMIERGCAPRAETEDIVNFKCSTKHKKLMAMVRNEDAIVAASMSTSK